MLGGLILILACQVAGVFTAATLGLPVPGPVVGMVAFLGVLLWRKPAADARELAPADGLLKILALLFVPAGVGVVVHLPELLSQWLPALVGVVASWFVALTGTAGLAVLMRRRGRAASKAAA